MEGSRRGRLQTTTSDKRLTCWLRAVDRSARLPRNLVYAIPCYDGGWSSVGPGGPCGGDRPSAARERAAAHGARYFKKLFSAVARLCGLETALCYPLRLGG